MIQILFRLSFIAVFLMTLVHAATAPPLENSSLAPHGSKSFGGLSFSQFLERYVPPTCKTLKCAANRKCVKTRFGPKCVVPKGQPCSPGDFCEGRYRYLHRDAFSDISKTLNSYCDRNDCERGLYCDLNKNQCLRNPTY